jgi:sulfite reductase (NADPH) flavoprotein alpha-component
MSQNSIPAAVPLDPEARVALDHLAARLGPAGLWWAAGYLAGLAQAGGLPAGANLGTVAAPGAETGVLVLTASQTGNARRLGEKLREALAAAGHTVKVVGAADVNAKQLAAARTLFAVASTQGEGEPPDEARGLWELLAGRKAPKFADTAFAVFGLGDSSYPLFCEAGKFLDERFATLGAQRLLDRVDADVEYADEADAWIAAAVAAVPAPAVRAAAPVAFSFAPAAVRDADKDHPREVGILAAQRIVARQADRAVVHYELEAGEGFAYEPGDSLGVWPLNPAAVVARVAAHLPAAVLDAPVVRGKQERPLGEWLGEHLEITRLARPFLEAQAERSGAAELAAVLDKSPAGAARLQAFVASANVADVLERFPVQTGREWSAGELLAALRPLAPRLYSIASSRAAVGEEVHLTIASVDNGAASGHLWQRGTAASGNTVRAYLERNTHFRLPTDAGQDVIMIGPGTGVAPFRAFVQERGETGASGRNWLFFGARHFDTEFLYQLEWQQALKDGRLSRLDLAFSRDQAQKIYVQDRLREQAADLWAWLQGGASLYVCGDATRMAPDVHAALRDVAQQQGGLDAEAAEAWLAELAATKRYLRDVY